MISPDTRQMCTPQGLHPGRQHGSALIIALVMLLLMTLIGVTAMQTTVMQERMAGNTRDRQLAFEAAEAALRSAETYLVSPSGAVTFLNPAPAGSAPNWLSVNWTGTTVTSVPFSVTGATVAREPAYIIEELGVAAGTGSLIADEAFAESRVYRITAQGWGGSEGAVVRLQTIFRRE